MSEPVNYLRGAFIAYEPGGSTRVLPFRINPETLSRTYQVEQGRAGSGTEGVEKTAGKGEIGADAALGALRQTFSVQLRFDFDDRLETTSTTDASLGILPELSALEDLLYPVEAPADRPSDGKEPVRARRQRPTVLFVWSKKRRLPVRINGMTINETLFNAELNPLRAEVDVQLEVLGDADSRDNKIVQDALFFTDRERIMMARTFESTTAVQATNFLPPGL